MIGIASRLISTLIVGSCFLSITLFFLSLAASLRLLPKLLELIFRVLRWFMVLSYRLYAFIVERLADPAFRLFEIDLYAVFARLMIALLLSTLVGLTIHLLVDLSWSIWIIAGFALHGALVGLIWDRFLDPGGLMLGVNLNEIQ